MANSTWLSWTESIAGAFLVLFVLLDFFLTVLYARIGSGIISYRIGSWSWQVFKWIGKPFVQIRGRILSYCGPVILILLVAVWGFALTLGSALVIHPRLGRAIVATQGSTPTDFGTAMFVAGNSLAIVGSGDYTPKTRTFRWLFFANSLGGMSVMFLTTTYIIQVYIALQSRNAFALKIHLATKQTGDAAQLIAGVGPLGHFDQGYSTLSEIAGELTSAKESHHFYPVVFYFRFEEAFYSVSRCTLSLLDTVTLIQSALSEKAYGWLKQSGAASQIWDASKMMVKTLGESFLQESGQRSGSDATEMEKIARWRRRYRAALTHIQSAGIRTIENEKVGEDLYVSLRSQWDDEVMRLARFGGYKTSEIDPVGCAA